MTKRFYKLIIQLLYLMLFVGLLQSLLRFIKGEFELITKEIYPAFFITAVIISLFLGILIMKYYWLKKYWFAFSAAVIVCISSVIHTGTTYILISTLRQHPLYIPTLIAFTGASMVYSISLIFPPAGKHYWLRVSGIFQTIINLAVALSIYWILYHPSAQTNEALAKIHPWLSLASCLILILFILNFKDEARQIKEEKAISSASPQTMSFWQKLAVLLIVVTVGMGIKLGSDTWWSVHWTNQNFRETLKLTRTLEPRAFVDSKGDTLYYGLLKPLNYDSTKKYPLLINLSQGAEAGKKDNIKIRQLSGAAAAQLFMTDEYRKKYPAFIFVPYCPTGSSWGGHPGWTSSADLLYGALTALDQEEPAIDAKRHYVTGISIAGYGTWHVISGRPDLFAAAIPLCGGGDQKLASKIINVAVWAFHGEDDKNVPVQESRAMINAIKKAGGHPKYTEFANEGHNIWYQTSITPGVWDWLFAQRQK